MDSATEELLPWSPLTRPTARGGPDRPTLAEAYHGVFMPCRVPQAWRFDFYCGRTLIGQKLGAVGSGQAARQLKHLYVI